MNKHTPTKTSSVQSFSADKRQSGFSLIEIMIAALILSIGILGVAGLQVVGMKGTHQSYMKQQAMGVVQSVIERMYANPEGVVAGNYRTAQFAGCNVLPTCAANTANCSVSEIAHNDLHNVICGYKVGAAPRTGGVQAVAAGDISGLSNGLLTINCANNDCATGDVQIEIQWRERELSKDQQAVNSNARTDSITINSRILPL